MRTSMIIAVPIMFIANHNIYLTFDPWLSFPTSAAAVGEGAFTKGLRGADRGVLMFTFRLGAKGTPMRFSLLLPLVV